MKNLFQKFKNLQPQYKAALYIFLGIILIILISLLSSKLPMYFSDRNVKIDFPTSVTLPDEIKAQLRKAVIQSTETSGKTTEDTISAIIRSDSYSEIKDNDYIRTSFLIDIDNIEQTYQVSAMWSPTGKEVPESLVFNCPKISESKYPNSECIGAYNNSHNTNLHLPYETTIKNQKVLVKSLDNPTLQIYLYSCNSDNPPIKETEEKVKDWVKNEVKDPLADKYQYNVRTGYCEGDPI